MGEERLRQSPHMPLHSATPPHRAMRDGDSTHSSAAPPPPPPCPRPSPPPLYAAAVFCRSPEKLLWVVRRNRGVRVGRCGAFQGVLPIRGLAKPRDMGWRERNAGAAGGDRCCDFWAFFCSWGLLVFFAERVFIGALLPTSNFLCGMECFISTAQLQATISLRFPCRSFCLYRGGDRGFVAISALRVACWSPKPSPGLA